MIEYRILKPEESLIYRALRLESLKLFPPLFHAKYEELVLIPRLKTEEDVINQTFERFVMGAFRKGNLVGICVFVKDEKCDGNIYQMYVKAALQGEGIGAGLIQATIAEGLQRFPHIDITLEVAIGNSSAIGLYQKIGFEKIESHVSQNTIAMRYYR